MIRNWMNAVAVLGVLAAYANAQHNPAEHNHKANEHESHDLPAMPPDAETLATPVAGPHGGQLQDVGGVQVETVVDPGGIRLFAYNKQGQPTDIRSVRGVATLQIAGNAKRYRYDLFPEILQDESAESLGISVDLSQIAGRKVDINFQLAGLVAGERQPTQFAASVTMPMTKAQQVAAAIAKQKICPVSSQPLGSMGKPIPVTVDNETIYVCCAGCIDKAKANFATYLKKLQPAPQLVAAPATDADVEAIKLQKVCPVMDEPLGGMGTPLKVTGLRRDVFLCCKGCLKFLEKDPEKYLAMLPPLPDSNQRPWLQQ